MLYRLLGCLSAGGMTLNILVLPAGCNEMEINIGKVPAHFVVCIMIGNYMLDIIQVASIHGTGRWGVIQFYR